MAGNDQSNSDSGFIDLHCHLLPGIDDGCRDMAMTLECIRLWKGAGFVGAVCTPHMATTCYPANTPRSVAPVFEQVREALQKRNIDFQLWLGGEVRLSDRVVGWFEEHGVPALGDGKFVLIDWWDTIWPEHCTAACQYLLDHGYQPLLAHPERMGLPEADLLDAIRDLRAMGVLLQGNLNSIFGGEGNNARERSHAWLAADDYFALATDTHEPIGVTSRSGGLGLVRDRNAAQLDQLLAHRPRVILGLAEEAGIAS